jgi:hypothetical protein
MNTIAPTRTRSSKTALNRITAAVAAAGGALLAVVCLAAPADASPGIAIPTHLDHNNWIYDIGGHGPHARAPHVDTSVHTSPRTGPFHRSPGR